MKILSHITYGMFAAAFIMATVLFLMPASPFASYFDVKIVKSGSMEPSIMTGGIVVISARAPVMEGDVITFTSSGSNIPTTHRIIGTETVNGATHFVTKGDANEERDTETVPAHAVLGKVIFSLPYVGFVLDFARQPLGFALLIGLPALLIVIDEMEKIWKEIRRRRKPVVVQNEIPPLVVLPYVPAHTRVRMIDINRPVVVGVSEQVEHTSEAVVENEAPQEHPAPAYERTIPHWMMTAGGTLVIVALMANLWSIGGTMSYLSDRETSRENSMSARALDFLPTPDGTDFLFHDGVLVDDVDGALMTLVAPETGSTELRYDVSTEYVSGPPALCDAIQVNTLAPFAYTGALTSLVGTNVDFDISWVLQIAILPGAYLSGDICVIDIVYRGWDKEQSVAMGYDDEERVRLTFTTTSTENAALELMGVMVTSEEVVSETGTSTEQGVVEDTGEQGKRFDLKNNNGHGNDRDGNDNSNPGQSNDPADDTDDETDGGYPGGLIQENTLPEEPAVPEVPAESVAPETPVETETPEESVVPEPSAPEVDSQQEVTV